MSDGDDDEFQRTKEQTEAAMALRAASIGWIGSADAKATTIGSVVAVVLGLVSLDMATASRAASLEWIYWIFLALSVLSVGLCIATLWPVTNRPKYVRRSRLTHSFQFFGDIPPTYEEYVRWHPTKDDLAIDAVEQSYIVARIAKRKMCLVRWTIVCFVLALLSLALLAFAATVVPPRRSASAVSPDALIALANATVVDHE